MLRKYSLLQKLGKGVSCWLRHSLEDVRLEA